jgi:hypothetical protein
MRHFIDGALAGICIAIFGMSWALALGLLLL